MSFNTAFTKDKTEDFLKEEEENYGKIFQDLFENEKLPSKEEIELQAKNLKQRGFQISNSGQSVNYAELVTEIASLKAKSISTSNDWNEYCASYVSGMSKRYNQTEDEIIAIQNDRTQHESTIKIVVEKKEQVREEMKDLRKKATEIKQEQSQSCKGTGESIIDQATIELEKLIQLQEGVHVKVKKVYDAQYTHRKASLDAHIENLRILRLEYNVRLNNLKSRLEQLATNGINLSVARKLITLGLTMAGVAGFFFAIFCSSEKYSSNDLLSYFFQSLITAISNSHIPLYEKFAYFLGFLLITTVISWLINLISEKKEPQSKSIDLGESYHKLKSDIETEGFRYSFEAKEKKWFSLWIKIVPVILIAGTLLMIISSNATAVDDVKNLSSATEGLLIGTAIAMGLSAVIYVYITYVIAPRSFKSDISSKLKSNIELVIAVLAFITVLVAFGTFKVISIGVMDDKGNYSLTGLYSIAAFIVSSLIASISLAYGLHYYGLLTVDAELKSKIDDIDYRIFIYSSSALPEIDINLKGYYDKLNEGLITHIQQKNASAFPAHFKRNEQPSSSGGYAASPKKTYPPSQNSFSEVEIFATTEYERWIFPEYARRIKLLESLYKTLSEDLSKTEVEEKKLIGELEEKNRLWTTMLQKLHLRKTLIQQFILKAKKYQIRKIALLSIELETAVSHLQDGFNLGLWHRRQDEK